MLKNVKSKSIEISKKFTVNILKGSNIGIENIFRLYYKYFPFKTVEDNYHKNRIKKKIMNKVKIEFENEDECNECKNNLKKIMDNQSFYKKYNITWQSILDFSNYKLNISFLQNCICVYFNHYYLSGPNMFVLLNQMFDNNKVEYLNTNSVFGIIKIPTYIKNIIGIKKKKNYPKDIFRGTIYNKIQNILVENKRFYTYWYILNRIYQELDLERDLIVGIPVAFNDIDYLNNNIGVIIISFSKDDTVSDVERKIKKNSFHAYTSNFILQLPINNSKLAVRDYVDCIISSSYIKTDKKIKIGWNIPSDPIEEVYVGSVSVIKTDGTFDLNTCISTKSKRFKYKFDYEKDFFD